MDYRDEEYLNLFKQVKEQRIVETDYSFEQLRGNATNFNRSNEMLKETPNYADYSKFRSYNEPNINEVQRNNYSQDFNVNEFIIETRVNGENINEVRRQGKEDRLNEVMEHLRQERLNEVKKTQETKNLNETVNFNDVDYVTLEMFDKARYNSMMKVVRILG